MVSNKRLKPPKARKKIKKNKVHGLTINDDYSWLRDNNWQEVLREPSLLKPNIKKYLDEENNWTKQKLKTFKNLKKLFLTKLNQELMKMINLFLLRMANIIPNRNKERSAIFNCKTKNCRQI